MVAKYSLYLEPEVHAGRLELPGHVRQDIRARIAALATNPRPAHAQQLQLAADAAPENVEIWRLRIGHWRIIYGIHELEKWVWVLAIRRRPPYDYNDLSELIDRLA